ncbi:cation diffusion facilitator family transporter [Patulibacter minatonensis]|uniref:cation diffusion facilitator family transporter n=1 Tax=Patulibacter minatonensis TaxID=298163 RepID=UPI00047E1AA4|nr:cation diffusion facilitator family transporter [Patulibacter minatonensis]
MAHDHSHGIVTAGARHRRALTATLALTATYLVVELVVGLSIGSLALISDAGHMLTDTLGLALALTAIVMAQGGADDQRTYGRYRLEALASLANAVLLFAVAVYVLIEAVGRFSDPADVPGLGLLVVASVGLVVNVASFLLLRAGAKESLNVRGAFLEVWADMIGSLGVLAAGVVMLATDWPYADPIVGVAIGLFVLPRAWRLGADAVHILMEGAPRDVDVAEVRTTLAAVPGVAGVHDLHVWTLTSGTDMASAHLRMTVGADGGAVLGAATALLRERFGISHATIQTEPSGYDAGAEPGI